MEPEELLERLVENGVVEDDGERVSLTQDFEESLETYRELVDRKEPDELAEQTSEMIDDVPLEDLKAAFREHDGSTVARYLAIRSHTDMDDQTAMVATEAIGELTDPTIAKCGKCGFEAPMGSEEWDTVQDPSMGEMTQCPECESTDIRLTP